MADLTCNNDEDCGSHPEDMMCLDGDCACRRQDDSLELDRKGKIICVEKKPSRRNKKVEMIVMRCRNSQDCPDRGTICGRTNTCECNANLFHTKMDDEGNMVCEDKDLSDIAEELGLGGDCFVSSQCPDPGQSCVKGKCVCNTEYVNKVIGVSSSICRDTKYHKKKGFNQTEAAIFGSLFVACLLVAGIVYICKRSRKKRSATRSEASAAEPRVAESSYETGVHKPPENELEPLNMNPWTAEAKFHNTSYPAPPPSGNYAPNPSYPPQNSYSYPSVPSCPPQSSYPTNPSYLPQNSSAPPNPSYPPQNTYPSNPYGAPPPANPDSSYSGSNVHTPPPPPGMNPSGPPFGSSYYDDKPPHYSDVVR